MCEVDPSGEKIRVRFIVHGRIFEGELTKDVSAEVFSLFFLCVGSWYVYVLVHVMYMCVCVCIYIYIYIYIYI